MEKKISVDDRRKRAEERYANNVKYAEEIITSLIAKCGTFENVIAAIQNSVGHPTAYVTAFHQNVIDEFSLAIKLNPEILFKIANIIPEPPNSISSMLNDSLFNPTTPIQNAFNYDPKINKTVNSKYRYLVNMSSAQLKQAIETPDSVENVDVLYNAKLFLELSNQSRWGNLWTQIISSTLWQETESRSKTLGRFMDEFSQPQDLRMAQDLYSIQTIFSILKRFKTLPFFTFGANRIKYNEMCLVNWGTCIVPLLYSLLELSKEEKGHNVTDQDVIAMIQTRILAAYTSFETEMLTAKSVYSEALKVVTSQITHHVRRIETLGGNPTVEENLGIEEIWIGEESYEKLIARCQEKMFPAYYVWFEKQLSRLKSMSDPVKVSEYARWLFSNLLIQSNPGIYYKTALTLEVSKSIESQIKNTLKIPMVKEYIVLGDVKYPFAYDWTSGSLIWNKISANYLSRLDQLSPTISQTDFEQFFVTMLTSNSQGTKLTLEEYDPTLNSSDVRGKLLVSVAGARVAAFVLETSTYYALDLFIQKLNNSGLCTIRFQNNRRARIVEIVPNHEQTAYSMVLKVFNEMKKHYPSIAVGKQMGGIIDMTTQLQITSNRFGVSASSDVTGMDASTQPFVGVMFPQLLAQWIRNTVMRDNNFFAFQPMAHTIINATGFSPPRTEVISGMVKNIILVLQNRSSKDFKLKDHVFKNELTIASNIFESGRYDTSAQHTVLLDIISEEVAKGILLKYGQSAVNIIRRRFGDDALTGFIFSSLSESTEITRDFCLLEQQLLKDVGFEIEIQVSRYFGDFLQQMAFCGVAVPKSARTSIYCDERSDTRNRDTLAKLTIINDVTMQAAQRCYAPANVISIARASFIAFKVSTTGFSKKPTQPRWKNFFTQVGLNVYLTYPWIIMFFPPYNFSSPALEITDGREIIALPQTSLISTVGDSKYVFLYNHLVPDHIKRAASRFWQDSNIVEGVLSVKVKGVSVYYLDIASYFVQKLQDYNLLSVLLLSKHSRNQKLSETRRTLLTRDIATLSNRLAQFYDPNKMKVSSAATSELKTMGISLPVSLTYHTQPQVRIEDLFASKEELPTESASLNAQFWIWLNTYSQTLPKGFKDKLVNCALTVTELELKLLNIEYDTRPEFPLLPGYYEGSDYDLVTRIFGSPFKARGNVAKALSSVASKYSGSFDLQMALAYGKQTLDHGPKAYDLFIKSLALDETQKEELSQLIVSDSVSLHSLAYTSGFVQSNLFGISGTASGVENRYQLNTILSRSATHVVSIMVRDWIYMNVRDCYKRALSVTFPVQATLLVDQVAIQRRLGINTIVY